MTGRSLPSWITGLAFIAANLIGNCRMIAMSAKYTASWLATGNSSLWQDMAGPETNLLGVSWYIAVIALMFVMGPSRRGLGS